MRKLIYAAPILVFSSLAVFLYLGLGKDPKLLPSALIGKPVPQFDLPALAKGAPNFASGSIEGKPVLVNFFASWCGPCRIEHPLLMGIAARGDIPVYGINNKDAKINADRWLAQLGNPFTEIGADLDGRAAIDWGVYGLPETFLVSADGEIIFKHVGPLTPDVYENEIMARVRELNK